MEEPVQYAPEELERFLLEVDRGLNTTVKIIVIGGAVIGMRYSSEHSTTDIDLWDTPETALLDHFQNAVARAKKRTGLDIKVDRVTIAQPPYEFEERLQQYTLEGLTHLEIWFPERHDLVLMKTARGETPDLEAIVEIHQREPLDVDLLLARCSEMRSTITGTWSGFRVKFLAMIEAVFGESMEKDIANRFPPE